ncbi:hypothetical protein Y032_1036g3462 [Ancylostoma ceylanicum]|uniref:Uncharacterized protein n=1 Tax=Ancylostoma ceylanicum TaxID=53326 RepID=A0A016W7B6_9BILA|nr:hypothetical protein Y032_1036g3462 [Ancylostoma ceylanicum]
MVWIFRPFHVTRSMEDANGDVNGRCSCADNQGTKKNAMLLKRYLYCVGFRSRRITNDTYRSTSESDTSDSDVDRYVSFIIRRDRNPTHHK